MAFLINISRFWHATPQNVVIFTYLIGQIVHCRFCALCHGNKLHGASRDKSESAALLNVPIKSSVLAHIQWASSIVRP